VTFGTKKLEQLYETFEKKILNSTAETAECDNEDQSSDPNEIPKISKDNSDDENVNDDIYSDLGSLDEFDIRDQNHKGQYSADTFADVNDSEDSDDEDKYDDDDDDGTSDSSADEYSSNLTGLSVKEIRAKKLSDPRRLHPDLWFNEKGEVHVQYLSFIMSVCLSDHPSVCL
jgi:hypothetical protein